MMPAVETMLTMAPLCWALNVGTTRRAQKKCESTPTAMHLDHSSSVMSSTGLVGPDTPALLTRMSSPPQVDRTCSKQPRTSASFDRSPVL